MLNSRFFLLTIISSLLEISKKIGWLAKHIIVKIGTVNVPAFLKLSWTLQRARPGPSVGSTAGPGYCEASFLGLWVSRHLNPLSARADACSPMICSRIVFRSQWAGIQIVGIQDTAGRRRNRRAGATHLGAAHG